MVESIYEAVVKSNKLTELSRDDFLSVYSSSTAKIYPYQIASARFALRSNYLKGCILSDECSLGKTYTALLVTGQLWYEGKENILVVLPSNLVNQWQHKIDEHFTIPYSFWNNTKKLPDDDGIVLTTYDNFLKHVDTVKLVDWDMVVFDEADVLSNFEAQRTQTIKDAIGNAYKLLITPTPMKNSIMDIYGLIHFIDESVLPDAKSFYDRYFRKPENWKELTSWVSQFAFRTLKVQTTDYVSFSRRIPITVDYSLTHEEKELYKIVSAYLKTDNKVAYPEIDEYNLSLRFFNTLSSSTKAFSEMLNEPISKTYGSEKQTLEIIQSKAKAIEANSKTLQLIKILKPVFSHLKTAKVNQKAIVFVSHNDTIDVLDRFLSREGYKTITCKSNDCLERFRNDDDVQIFITNDSSAKGLDIEYCPVVVNFDMIYNVILMEQRICRCHRQGQQSDVLVINLLSRENMGDVRMLELINKRTLQFNGIFGMSDDIVGNFDTKIKDVLTQFRPLSEVAENFKQNLTEHKSENEELVENAENVLFTTFTKSIADKVSVTPQYIEDKSTEVNNELWEVIKYYFEKIKPDWYTIDEEHRTLKLIEGYNRPYLFDYREDYRNKHYEGYQQYGMSKDFVPIRGRISLTSTLAKGILHEFDLLTMPEAKLFVEGITEPCEIGLYMVSVTTPHDNIKHKSILIGQTKSGKILSEHECAELLKLPVIKSEERNSIDVGRFGTLLDDFGNGKLDEKLKKEQILKDYLQSKEGSIAYEVEKLKLLSGRKKAQLEEHIKELKNNVSDIKRKLADKKISRLEELELTKQLRLMERDLMKEDEGLFYAKAQVDVDTENAIAELTNEYNFNVLIGKKFKIQLLPQA